MEQSLDNVIRQQLGFSIIEAKCNSEILINAFDPQHKIVLWNKKAEQYFGINAESAIGKKLEELVPYARKSDKFKHLLQALSGTPIYIANDKYERRHAFYEQWVLPVKKNGEVIAVLNIVKDINNKAG